jgi:hypothetical protein
MSTWARPCTKADAEAATERDIVVTVTANGAIVGGMTTESIPRSICRLTSARPRLEVMHVGGEMELVAWKAPTPVPVRSGDGLI